MSDRRLRPVILIDDPMLWKAQLVIPGGACR